MRNHNEKRRDIARSILPSTRRKEARAAKAASARRARARNVARLHRLMRSLDDIDSFEEDLHSYDLDDNGWDGMVEQRRDGDKLGPIMRWAEATIASNPRLAEGDFWVRRSYFAAILGDTLAGRHALSHIDHLCGQANPYLFCRVDWDAQRQERLELARRDYALRMTKLRAIVSAGRVPNLNARIRALTPPPELLRSLAHASCSYASNMCRVHPGLHNRFAAHGYEPWLLQVDDLHGWATVSHELEDHGRRQIAFTALDQVHAEAFGYDD